MGVYPRISLALTSVTAMKMMEPAVQPISKLTIGNRELLALSNSSSSSPMMSSSSSSSSALSDSSSGSAWSLC